MNIKVILLMIIAGLAVLFIIQNVSAVTVGIFFWTISLSLALLIFLVLAIGFALGWFLHSFMAYMKVKKDVAAIQRDLGTGKKK